MGNLKERKDQFFTVSGTNISPVYSGPTGERENPGKFPFTRGVHGGMYRNRLWTMRQYAGFGTAQETNERYKYLLKQGTTGLSVAFDLPTQMGRDSDHSLSLGEVGKVGVAISTLDDMGTLFEGIPLQDVSVSMTINSTAAVLLSMLLITAEKQGVGWDKLRGTTQNDILKEYIARGTYIYPPKPAMKITTDIIEFCSKEVPQWNTVSISGYHIREAGSTAIQEVAFTLADGMAYVEAALSAGLDVDDFAPRLAFFFNCHNEFLEEIAKFRAARILWAKIMRDRFKAKKDSSCQLRFHTQTAGSSLTAQQPYNNIIRTTLQALAAVLGGTQSLHTNSFDEALGLPTAHSAQIALRTQQIIGHESGVADVVDPFGGSHVIECWTDEIVTKAGEIIGKIDAMGGMLAAIEAHYPQREIEQSAYQFQREIEEKQRIVVGVNSFVSDQEETVPVLKIDSAKEKDQIAKVRAYKASRDEKKAKSSLDSLESLAREGACLMPPILEGLRAHVTLGEISDTLRGVFGEFQP